MTKRTALLVGAVALALLLAACGSSGSASSSATVDPNTVEVNPAGDIPDNQAFVPYTVPSGDFSVTVPEGWSRNESAGVVTFTDNFNSIRLETIGAAAAPTAASATADEVPALAAATPAYQAGDVTTVDRTAGTAVLISYQAERTPDPVTGQPVTIDVERYEFWQGGREAIITLSGGQGADNVDPWRIVTDSFTWQ
ncbi:MAG: hypothetical protein JNK12_20115 [Acidimicrobiales bacterium]|nr:hypothetical protein [Acidimicrobiales bacterium]